MIYLTFGIIQDATWAEIMLTVLPCLNFDPGTPGVFCIVLPCEHLR